MSDCTSLQKSLAWCQGRPELPGVKRRIYYISKNDILQWPILPHDANGRMTDAAYQGNFTLRADASWKFIDIIAEKSQLTSDPQGEYPSQTQLNKLTAVHPAVGEQASSATAYLNNNDNVFLVEDMRGAIRVVGSDKWLTKTTISQDLGQGSAGTAGTTITVEAPDECPAPFYYGNIVTEEGTFSGAQNTGNGSSSNSGGDAGTNNGGNSGSGSSSAATPSFNNTVVINGSSRTVSVGSSVTITGNLTSLILRGSNMTYLSMQESGKMEQEMNITNGSEASWSGNISAPNTIAVRRIQGSSDDPQEVLWFNIILQSSGGGGGGGDTSGDEES